MSPTILSSIESGQHHAIVDWITKWVSEPFEGRPKDGPVCPYTALAMTRGEIFTAITPDDGTDIVRLADGLRAITEQFITEQLPTGPLRALVIGMPHIADAQVDNLAAAEVIVMQTPGFEDITNTWMAPLDPYDPGAGWPEGFFVPMPVIVMRRLAPFDVALCRRNARLFGRFRIVFRDLILSDTLPSNAANSYPELCQQWNVPERVFHYDEERLLSMERPGL